MKKLLFALMCLIYTSSTQAQFQSVVFNYEKSYFNENMPLPAEEIFMISGNVRPGTDMVEVSIHNTGNKWDEQELYKSVWKRPFVSKANVFTLPMNYELRGNRKYNFRFSYFENIQPREREELQQRLFDALDAYVDESVDVNGNKMRLNKSDKSVMSDLNSIVKQGLSKYRNRSDIQFDGFSDIVAAKLHQLSDKNLRNAAKYVDTKDIDKKAAKYYYLKVLMDDLKKMIHLEVTQILNTDLLVVRDSKIVTDYPTEKTPNVLSLNAGYGGVYLSGDVDNLEYRSAPYAGISFPLGHKAFSNKFWTNTSVSFGLFLTDLEESGSKDISGPLFNRPSYAALGYKVFNFVRINGGATFLQSPAVKTSNSSELFNEVYVRPFIGISAEFNLWLGFGSK